MHEMTDKTKGSLDSGGLREADEQIRQRLLAMERDNAWLRSRVRLLGLGLLVTLVLGGMGAFGQGIPGLQGSSRTIDMLTTQRVVLTDASGAARAEWRVDEEGDARLGLFDRQGRPRLSLAVLSNGSPGLSLINPTGQRRAGLALIPDGSTHLTFADQLGTPRVVLGTTEGDGAQLVFADATGDPQLALGLDESGVGTVLLPTEAVSEPEERSGGD